MRKIIFMLLSGISLACTSNAQWTTVTTGTISTFMACSFGNPSTVYVAGGMGTDSATIMKSTNAGVSFYHLNASFIPAGQCIFSCWFTSMDTGFVAGGDPSPAGTTGFIYKTVNGGTSWTSVVSGVVTALRSIQFTSSATGYASGGFNGTGDIYKTIDHGNTWTPIFSSGTPAVSLYKEYFVNDTTGYVIGDNHTAVRSKCITIKSGSVFSNVDLGAYNDFGCVYFSSADTGFVSAQDSGTYHQRMLKTTNGGTSWTSVYSSTAAYNGAVIRFADHSKGFMVGDANLATTDGGNTWSIFAPIPSPTGSYFDMAISGSVGIIVGESGMILRNGGVTGLQIPCETKPGINVYPNPFTMQTTISFDNEQTNTRIIITDVTGKEVRRINCTGTTLTIDRGQMKPGMYLMTITPANGITTTAKFAVQ